MAEGAFVSVYHEDLIANYPAVWNDDRMLATWLRLLVIADKLWPSPADIPRGVRTREFAELVKLGLVEQLPHHHFRLRGVDARRKRQQEHAKSAANARWNAPSNASSNAPSNARPMPTRPDHTQTTTNTGATRAPVTVPVKNMDGTVSEVQPTSDMPPDVDRLQRLAEELTGRPYVMANAYGQLAQKAIEEQLRPHRWGRVESAWRQIAARFAGEGGVKPTLRQLILGADDLLNPIPQGLDREAHQAEEQTRFDRRVEATRKRIEDMRTA